MTTVRQNRPAQTAPEAFRGDRRYWGSVEPPTSKAAFFGAVTAPAAEGDATVATIRMYGPIDSWGGWWGISAEDVAGVLDALPASVEQIILRINSPGGEVWEAMAILSMLGAHRARVTAVVDGIAASAASFIAAGCAETVMSKGSQMMIHSAHCIAWGNSEDMRKTADILDVMNASAIEVYTDKAGEKDWVSLLAAETWLTATAAVELGLADRIDVVPDAGVTATVGTTDDVQEDVVVVVVDENPEDAVSARIRAAAASARAAIPKPPSSSEPGTPNRKETVVANDEPQAGVQERLGATETETPEVAAAAPEVTPTAAAPTAGLPEGIVAIDANVLAELRSNAARGAEARAEQDRARRDGIIATALQEGRISASSREHFRALLEKDEEGTTAVLATLAKNTVPVEELGHQAVASDDAYPAHWAR
ncbi:Clp protease ClpP [Microbacterium hominis]|uniref:head maturation protease, ClpP-related n=1 Tax=Microbacterium TaxID=33882 RepID=UPI00168A73A5|nr:MULTISPECIES: head maturation protease, ClpP-related [Microbacterium]QOC26051.1 Clp protease ClpP [Microbacterium hominis]QOC30022.1 Clp protease ClpP [Microbacterium hominis]QYF98459.1 Clp protease ClpP [Microbacterium sp. PAMC21962]